ncbi:hypothetical protein E4V27_18295 [Proteus mirabilis]|nr:hypothetical protein E4V27_18295 [Proteus mirabilis]
MNKQLLDKIDRALTAQQDTIERQKTMLDDKDRDIAHLKNLLQKLTATQIEELERLPTLHESLKNTINEQRKAQAGWIAQRKTLLELMNKLASNTVELCNAQIQLTKLLESYQSTIALESSLSSDTEQLEDKLKTMKESQQRIMNSQQLLKEQLQRLEKQ